MKRFLIVLLFLAIVGGVVFFFGWVQLQIPSDGYAVVFTKTHGWEEEVIEPGEFAWRWQRLIPTNMELLVFYPEQRNVVIEVNGDLPSASVYRELIEDDEGFSYEVEFDISYRVDPAMLPRLASESDARPEELEAVYARIEADMMSIASEEALDIVESGVPTDGVRSLYATLPESVQSELRSELSAVEVLAVVPKVIRLPDMELYETARRLAQEVIAERAASLKAATDALAEQQVAKDNELVLLERYGEILDRYPVLLEYFRVGQETGGDPLDLQSIIDSTDE